MSITATFVKRLEGGFTGVAKLYRLSRPVKYGWEKEETERNHTQYVVISATYASDTGPEAYIFPADAEGKIIDWGEMPGSYKGGLDHSEAIANAGWLEAQP